MTGEAPTYEGEALAVLAFELSASQRSETERKIKRRLRDKKLGAYDPSRIEAIRTFKNDVLAELSKASRSKFWLQTHGPYADSQDWDVDGLQHHFEAKHLHVPKAAIGRFLPYAIYLYYLR